ncbi:cyclin-like protein [Catenaria anguillulae PL171]|uniref:Cyclin-like protein n=1 Tax=Catenaria anguillulae PL171 TaxID=765915 RepID=A0A1Y2HNH3_9FUNG|nr:cyclin-like protein [Catenaria anguillulae PL171]
MLSPDWRFSKRDIDTRYSMHMADRNQVRNLRAKGINFLFSLATRMLVSQATLATAATLFHRFFMSQSFDSVHQYDIATVAMYHAAKAEERVLKLDHVAEMAYLSANKDPHLHAVNEDERKKWVSRIRELEPWFAASIGFDFYIEHPYRPLNNFLTTTKVPVAVGRLAMVFINDSLRTTLCLQHPPTVIAAAALRLASKLAVDPTHVPLRPDWMQLMNVDRLAVLDAASQMLDVHEARWAAVSTAPPPSSRSATAVRAPDAGGTGGMSSSSTTPGSTYSGGVRTPNNVVSSSGHGSASGTPLGHWPGCPTQSNPVCWGVWVGSVGQCAARTCDSATVWRAW